MIKNIAITNFKSIKNLKVHARKINIFIGEPNTGKSNILEALGLLSGLYYDCHDLKKFVRFERTVDLFYNQSVQNTIEINTDDHGIEGKLEKNLALINVFNIEETINFSDKEKIITFRYGIGGDIQGSNGGSSVKAEQATSIFSPIKYYLFKPLTYFNLENVSFLHPPFGENLSALANANPEISEIMVSRFKEFGYDVLLSPYENKISILKKTKNVYVSLPYHVSSDSIRRIIFYMAAMKSNTSSVLVFEEPESNIFPYFVTMLAESIGLDNNDNQYFIATHNPYFLLSVLEKAPKSDINVFVTYLDKSGTNVKCLSNSEIPELMEHDPFLNLNLFIEKDKQ
jgi:AAA15 family ATPase/GTPase